MDFSKTIICTGVMKCKQNPISSVHGCEQRKCSRNNTQNRYKRLKLRESGCQLVFGCESECVKVTEKLGWENELVRAKQGLLTGNKELIWYKKKSKH